MQLPIVKAAGTQELPLGFIELSTREQSTENTHITSGFIKIFEIHETLRVGKADTSNTRNIRL
jgi:hypothetical protein